MAEADHCWAWRHSRGRGLATLEAMMHHMAVSTITLRRGGVFGMLAALVLVIGVLWMHGASTGHQGVPSAGHDHVAVACIEEHGSHCPTEPGGHDGAACQVKLAAASAPVTAPSTGILYVAPPTGEVRSAVITAQEAGDGSGCGPPSRAALSILRI